MKIVCDSCGAKYSIADEKVSGKVFKIRCKKCSAVMVVRGDQVAAQRPEEESATATYDYGGDVVWHVVIDGEQQGPFAPKQISEMIGDGTIGWDAYIWREGFDGWTPAQDVEELVQAITGQSAAQAQAAPAGPPSEAPTAFAQSMGADPFADSAHIGGDADSTHRSGEGASEGLFAASRSSAATEEVAARASRDPGIDLFGQSASPFGEATGETEEDVVASPASAPHEPGSNGGGAQLTGARNENSVLFSLANLQALATGTPGAPAGPAAAPKAGNATGEGSGLIDIRALAGAAPSPAAARGSVDDLLSLGGSGFGGSLGAPVLTPVKEERNLKPLILIAAAVVLLAGIGLTAVLVLSGKEEPIVAANTTVPAAAAVSAPAAAPAEPSKVAAAPQAEAAPTKIIEPTPAGLAEPNKARPAGAGERRTRGEEPPREAAPAGAAAAPPAAAREKAAPGSRSIDDLLAGVLEGGGGSSRTKAPAAAPAAESNLPDTPPRDSVLAALRSVQNAVAACGQGQHGVANATISVSGATGRVASATVSGQFQGTPIGSCVARAVRGARFPRFSRDSFQVSFPYRF